MNSGSPSDKIQPEQIQPEEIRQQFVDTPRMRFHYREHGDPTGLPMLLIHGSFGNSRWWVPFMDLLPTEIRAIALDLRGSGQSEHTDSGYSIADQAADVHEFVLALGLKEIDLVGHSSGGAVAIEFALSYPGLVSTLTLVDSVPIEGLFTPLDTFVLLEQMKDDDELLRRSLSLLMPTLDPQLFGIMDPSNGALVPDYANKEFFDAIVNDAKAVSPQLFAAVATALNNWNRFADAHQMTLPSLIVWGEQDEIVSRDATTRMLIALPGANNLEILRGVGHSPMIEAPLTLAEKIIDFITEDYASFGSVRDSL